MQNIGGAAVEVDITSSSSGVRPEKVVYEVADIGHRLISAKKGSTVTMRSHRGTPGRARRLIPSRIGVIRIDQAPLRRAFIDPKY